MGHCRLPHPHQHRRRHPPPAEPRPAARPAKNRRSAGRGPDRQRPRVSWTSRRRRSVAHGPGRRAGRQRETRLGPAGPTTPPRARQRRRRAAGGPAGPGHQHRASCRSAYPRNRDVPLANRSRGPVRPSPRAARAHWGCSSLPNANRPQEGGFEPADPLPADDYCLSRHHHDPPRSAPPLAAQANQPPDSTRTAPGMRRPGAAHLPLHKEAPMPTTAYHRSPAGQVTPLSHPRYQGRLLSFTACLL